MKKIIAVDFDGTITKKPTFPDAPTPEDIADHCAEVLQRLHKAGCTIILNTCRRGPKLADALRYCKEQSIPLDYVNENASEAICFYDGDCRKIFADYYIDDMNLGGFPGWLEAERIIMGVDNERLPEICSCGGKCKTEELRNVPELGRCD